jgi:rhodanese-related sulfurtransferase
MRLDNVVLRLAAITLLALGGALTVARANGSGAFTTAGGEEPEVSASDLKAKVDSKESVIIIDTRKEVHGQTIKGAIHVPLTQIKEWAKTADKSQLIVTFCACPHDETSQAVVHILRGLGFENAFSLTGGFYAARQAGLEVVTAPN